MIPPVPPAHTPSLLSVEQVAGILKLTVRTVRSYVRNGSLKATRIGKQYRVALGDLETFTGGPVESDARRVLLFCKYSFAVVTSAISVKFSIPHF